jgi:hypothetical protein
VHIRLDQAAFFGRRRLKRYAGETVRYILSTDPLAKLWGVCDRAAAGFYALQHAGPGRFKCRCDPIQNIALNPHKLVIVLRQRVSLCIMELALDGKQ